ncbi:hypothetical protein [Komagataeibacter oboediens]|nr:hypothetical protein [Komagataeibacter oboediens]
MHTPTRSPAHPARQEHRNEHNSHHARRAPPARDRAEPSRRHAPARTTAWRGMGVHAPAGHVMSALSHTMGGDLDLSATGGIAVVTGAEQTRQALLRRLCTNAAAYIWQPDYGAGLPARVGTVMDEAGIRALVLEQAQGEAGIDPSQPVTVTITNPRVGAYLLAISYTDATTGTVQELTLGT